jgi:glutamate-ammonia-ligase adenylyltransferase
MPQAQSTGRLRRHHWQQWLDWAAEHGVAVPDDAGLPAGAQRVWEASEFAALTAARSPETLAALIADGASPPPRRRRACLGRALRGARPDTADEPGLHKALRRFRRRQMLRIIWRDLSGWADLDETLET